MSDEQVPDHFDALFEAGFTVDELEAVVRELMFAVQIGQDFHQNMRVNLEDVVDWTPEKRVALRESIDKFLKDKP